MPYEKNMYRKYIKHMNTLLSYYTSLVWEYYNFTDFEWIKLRALYKINCCSRLRVCENKELNRIFATKTK